MPDERPLLIVDIDGVLNPYDGPCPLAWIDDLLGPAAWAWARSRPVPTLLLPIDPAGGPAEAHVRQLEVWGRDPGPHVPPP